MVSYDNPGEFPGYTSQTNWIGTQGGNGYIPSNLVSNPFPGGLNQPTGNSQGPLTLVGYGAGQLWPKGPHPIGQIYEWSMDFQYQVSPHSVAEIGYTGVRGRKLLFGNPNFDLDQLPTADLALGNKLNDLVPNPFSGVITDPNSYLSSPTIAYNQLLRPFPEYTYLQETRSLPGARSQFDALYAKYNHAFSNGLSAIVTYQWSKNMDDGSEALVGWTINNMWRDATNPKLDYAISTHDVPQSFAVAFTYQLPYGSGMRWGGSCTVAGSADSRRLESLRSCPSGQRTSISQPGPVFLQSDRQLWISWKWLAGHDRSQPQAGASILAETGSIRPLTKDRADRLALPVYQRRVRPSISSTETSRSVIHSFARRPRRISI